MSYRVLWAPEAEKRLEQILRDTKFPIVLAKVAKQIDGRLAVDPKDFGESRFETTRIAFARPLGLFFDVMDDIQTVVVYDVWLVVK